MRPPGSTGSTRRPAGPRLPTARAMRWPGRCSTTWTCRARWPWRKRRAARRPACCCACSRWAERSAGEALPGGLPFHAERVADALPGQLASSCLCDPGAEVLVDLVAHGLDAGQVLEEHPVVDLVPQPDAGSGVARALLGDHESAEFDALVADEDAGTGDEGLDLVLGLGTERASQAHGLRLAALCQEAPDATPSGRLTSDLAGPSPAARP